MTRRQRQDDLFNRYHFQCTCHVCSDESLEVSTGLICQKLNCSGLVVYDDKSWTSKCLTCGCTDLDLVKVLSEVKRIRSVIAAENDTLETLESCLLVYQKYLHPLN